VSVQLTWRLLMIVILVIVFGLVFTRRRPKAWRSEHRRRETPPPLPRHRTRREPTVRVGRLLIAIFLFPFVLFFWAIASLGDLVEGAVHVVLAGVSLCVALLGSFFGGRAGPQWRSTWREARRALLCVYRAGRRFIEYVGFGGFLEQVEDDIREARDLERGGDRPPGAPKRKPGVFPFEDRYRIESNLAGGGSTAHLFVVRRLQRDRPVGDRLVLKYFDMGLGSRLEEVMRESRGMQVAREMGIVLDHELGPDHFYYTMPYYEGETLTRASARIHRRLLSGQGMEREDVETCLGWMSEVLRILDAYHRRGVIHKDVKPDNLIVTDEGIRLVDLGLLTPVESALTLTTHGTEYFRDPEMVKLAVQGKRVREVDAARFDVYSAGAVLYLLLEGSFPACGPLSRFSRPVPMGLSTITSRAMAEGDKRYPSIAAMRADLEAYRAMMRDRDPDDIPMSALPSFGGFDEAEVVVPPPPPMPEPAPREEPVFAAPPPMPAPVPIIDARKRGRPAAFIAVVLGLLLALGGLVFLLRAVEPSPPPTAEEYTHEVHVSKVRGDAVATFVRRSIESVTARDRLRAHGPIPILIAAAEAAKGSNALEALARDSESALIRAGRTIYRDESLAGELEQWLVAEQRTASEVLWWLKPKLGAVPACVLWFTGGGNKFLIRLYFLGETRFLYGTVAPALALEGDRKGPASHAPLPTTSSKVLSGQALADFLIKTIARRRDELRTARRTVPPEPAILLVPQQSPAVEKLAEETRKALIPSGIAQVTNTRLVARVRAWLQGPAPRGPGVSFPTFRERMAELGRLLKAEGEGDEVPAVVYVRTIDSATYVYVTLYWDGRQWLHTGALSAEVGDGE
jgi:serine/threonine-protein kinase